MALRKVRPGDRLRIPAVDYNSMLDAARDFQRRKFGRGDGNPELSRSSTIMLVKNASGADVPLNGVLGIDAPLILPTDNEMEFRTRVALKGVTPLDSDHVGKFVVTMEPIAANAIGRAFVSGVCPVQIDISDASHGWADINDGDTAKLKSSAGDGSAKILYKESGTDTKWAVVQLGVLPYGSTESPTVIGDTIEGDDTADTTEWSRSEDGPLELNVIGRMVYTHDGDEKLYGFIRSLTFDECGLLTHVSGETRVEIDIPEDCT